MARCRGRKTRALSTHNAGCGERKESESRPNHSCSIAKEPEQQRRKEPAETTNRADQAGDGGHALREELRHELEDCAIACAQKRRASECSHSERDHRGPHQQESEGNESGQGAGQNAGATDPIGEHAANRPHQCRQHHESGCPEPGIGHREAELISQQCGQVHGEGDKSTEGQEIESRQCPGEALGRKDADHRAD